MTALGRLGSDERGMVTAETAVVLPVLVLLSLAGVAAVGVAQARVRCADAALVAARAVARGDPAAAGPLARAAAGPAVRLATSVTGEDTVVTARLPLRRLHWLGSVTIVETATVPTEPVMPP